jgi:adenylyl-sulfate kinase
MPAMSASETPPDGPGPVIWFTGLSGSGKSTIAEALASRLADSGHRVELLDGDVIRAHFPATGFSRAERDAHVRRVGFMASRLAHHGVTVLCSLISPYRETRDWVRQLCPGFVEVHVATPLDVCEERDAKGLYAKARAGEIEQFTGVSDPYEPPLSPEVRLDTTDTPVDAAVSRVIAHLAEGARA